MFADEALRGRREMTTGANQDDFHLRHVDVSRDLAQAVFADLRNARAGDACTQCGKPLEQKKTIEMGHIFKLGLRYSEPMRARVLTAEGKETPIVMGSYGIGIERIMAAAIEAHHDAERDRLAARDRAVRRRGLDGEGERRRAEGEVRAALRGALGRPASTSCSTTATSGRA